MRSSEDAPEWSPDAEDEEVHYRMVAIVLVRQKDPDEGEDNPALQQDGPLPKQVTAIAEAREAQAGRCWGRTECWQVPPGTVR